MPAAPPRDDAADPTGAEAALRALLRGRTGWWASADLAVLAAAPPLPPGAARLLLRRPLMGVTAGVRVEDADGAVLARAAGAGGDVGALLDPLALVTGLPPVVGPLPSRERRAAVDRLGVQDAVEVLVDDRPAVRGVLMGLPGGGPEGLLVVLDAASGLPLQAGPRDGEPALVLRVEQLDPRLDDDAFSP